MRGSDLVRKIYRKHHARQRVRPGEQVLDVLQEQGFFQEDTPVIDVATGPSPHVGYGLLERLAEDSEVYFTDWRPDTLEIHRHTYQQIKTVDPNVREKNLREYWLLGDVQREPYLIQGKAVIAHMTVPRINNGERLVLPCDEESMKATLNGLLQAEPERVALYLPGADSGIPENSELAEKSLDGLGVPYAKHENVVSAHFQPYRGTLITIDNP